jgi:branched-chain amino acid transport system ATP-binding protein
LGLLVVVVLGGVGSRGGVLVSALLFAVLPRLLSPLRETALLVGGIGMLGALVAHPRGLGSLPDLVRGRRAGREAHLRSGGVAIPDLLIGREKPRNAVDRETVGVGLRVDRISVSFGGVRALHEATLAVDPGEAVGIIGPNGAGKSTLIECVSGFVALEAGSISFEGTDLLTLPPRARTSLGIRRTFQIDGLVLDATVLNNVMMASHDRVAYGAIRGLAGSPRTRSIETEHVRSADRVLAALGMEDLRDLPARVLSGGQRRVLEIACCLYGGPRLAMFDEPSAGLAPDVIEQLGDRLRKFVERTGSALLLVEHNISLVERVCDRLYVIMDGHMVMDGPTSEVLCDPTIQGRLMGAAL